MDPELNRYLKHCCTGFIHPADNPVFGPDNFCIYETRVADPDQGFLVTIRILKKVGFGSGLNIRIQNRSKSFQEV